MALSDQHHSLAAAKRTCSFVLRTLKKKYAGTLTHLSGERAHSRAKHLDKPQTAFRILISTILSHRTRDANTKKASDALLSSYPTPRLLAHAPIETIRRLISPVGFYRLKSRYVKSCAKELVERFGGVVPMKREELVSLAGVGPKTSACVLNYAFDKEVVAVDVHVHRVSNRIGLVHTRAPKHTEVELTEIAPRGKKRFVNELLVLHGQHTCKPVTPVCSACPLKRVCAYYQSGGAHR